MRRLSLVIGIAAALAASGASAQSVDLTGTYQCVQMCRGDALAYVTQNGPQLNLLTEAGVPTRAWPDWFSPANRIWIDVYNQSAVYTPDGMTIQFDSGTIWQRYVPPPPPPLVRRRR
jgi:type II secretory pathway pseudopilin PulG